MRVFVTHFVVLATLCGFVAPKYIKGTLHTTENWAFLTRFCFRSAIFYQYTFEYSLCKENGYQTILMYDDVPTQWDAVYKSILNCSERERAIDNVHRKILLSPKRNESACILKENAITCDSTHRLSLSRAKWTYFAVANCNSSIGLKLNYTLRMLNGEGYWTDEFSADEQGILQTDIGFLVMFFLLLIWAYVRAGELHEDGMFHTTFKMFIIALFIQVISLLFLCIHYGIYGQDGIGSETLKFLGRLCASSSELIFLLVLILLAKGWTVVRGRLSPSSQMKLVILMTLYCGVYIIMFIWEEMAFDPGRVLYVYDSPAGYGLVALSIIAFCWFIYAVLVTSRKHKDKMVFYVPFAVVYSLWFLARPIIVLVSNIHVADWIREKVVNGVNLSVAYAAYMAFLVFTIPSLRNFPFHLKTTQVDVAIDDYEDDEHPYSPSPQYLGSMSPQSLTLFQGTSPDTDSIVERSGNSKRRTVDVSGSPEFKNRRNDERDSSLETPSPPPTRVPFELFSAKGTPPLEDTDL